MEYFSPFEFIDDNLENRPFDEAGIRDSQWCYIHEINVKKLVNRMIDIERDKYKTLAIELDTAKKKLINYTHNTVNDLKNVRDRAINDLNADFGNGTIKFTDYMIEIEKIVIQYNNNVKGLV